MVAVQIPGVAGAARTAARLMVRHVRPGARIIGLLRFPGDQTVLHIDLPAARSGAVGAVRRADDLVVLPALPIAVLPAPVLVRHDAVAVRELADGLLEEHQPIDEVGHRRLLLLGRANWSPTG